MKRMTTLLFAVATAGLLMGFSPQQEAPPAEKEAAPAEAAPAEAAPAEAAPAEAAPAEAAAPAAVTCKKYVECTCALDKAGCKDAKAAYKGKTAEDCSAEFTEKVQPKLDELATKGEEVPAKCQ